jgi:hypothetical protein
MPINRTNAALIAIIGIAAIVAAGAFMSRARRSEERGTMVTTPEGAIPPRPAAAAPGAPDPSHGVADNPPPAASTQSQAFVCRARVIDEVMWLDGAQVPDDLLQMIACGQTAQALDPLMELAKTGDIDAFLTLSLISSRCHGSETQAAIALQQDAAVRKLGEDDAPAEVIEKVERIFDVRRDVAQSQEEFATCTRLKADMAWLWPSLAETFSNIVGHPLDPSADGEQNALLSVARKLASAGTAADQMRLARMLLRSRQPEQRAEAVQWLQRAAKVEPDAKAQLAACMLRGCPTPSEDPAPARQLLASAASEGSRMALSVLADDRTTDYQIELPIAERYAWQQLHQSLAREGCLGSSAYVAWATNHPPRIELSSLAPEDAEAAQRTTADFIATRLAANRTRMGCN